MYVCMYVLCMYVHYLGQVQLGHDNSDNKVSQVQGQPGNLSEGQAVRPSQLGTK